MKSDFWPRKLLPVGGKSNTYQLTQKRSFVQLIHIVHNGMFIPKSP